MQGAHDDLVQLSATLKTLAVSLYKIANDIRLLSCGPRAGLAELKIPANEPGSSIMPGKVNPTQCEALAMISVQVMANDVAVAFGGAGGYLEMNVYKPLLIFNIMKSVRIMTDGCTNFRTFLVEGAEPNHKQIDAFLQRSLMLVITSIKERCKKASICLWFGSAPSTRKVRKLVQPSVMIRTDFMMLKISSGLYTFISR